MTEGNSPHEGNTPRFATEHALNQELLPKDVVILDAGLTTQEQERVIVNYGPDPSGTITDGLLGHYDFVIPG